MNSNKKITGIKGFRYLFIILTGLLYKVSRRFKLIIPGVFQVKATRIMISGWVFSHGSSSNFILPMCDLVVGLTFHVLLKPVNRSLVLVSVLFKLIQKTIHGVNLLYHFFALLFVKGADYLTPYEPAQFHFIRLKSFPGPQRHILLD